MNFIKDEDITDEYEQFTIDIVTKLNVNSSNAIVRENIDTLNQLLYDIMATFELNMTDKAIRDYENKI